MNNFLKKNTNLNVFLLIVILVTVAYFFGTKKNSQENNDNTKEETISLIPRVGSQAPDFNLKDINGKEYKLKDYQGEKYVLVIFETTWCPWCTKEREDLDDLYLEAEDKMAVITIDIGESNQTVKEHIKKYDIKRPWLLDDKENIPNIYAANSTPSHFLIDKKGQIVWMRPGYTTREILFDLLSFVR